MFRIAFARYVPIESQVKLGSRIAVQDVPHFGFAVTAVPFRRQGVVRMHLHREFVLRIDVFDQQRKLQAEFLVNFVAYQIAHIDFDQLFEVGFPASMPLPTTDTSPSRPEISQLSPIVRSRGSRFPSFSDSRRPPQIRSFGRGLNFNGYSIRNVLASPAADGSPERRTQRQTKP